MTLKLPKATDPTQARHNQILEANDVGNRKKGADLTLTSERLTMVSPNGTNFQIVVTDTGAIVAVPAVVSGNALPGMVASAGLFKFTGFAALNGIRFPDAAAAVTSVATAGLATGGPITSTGTVTVTAASKSDQQAGTSTTTAVTPAHAGDHDGDAKAWCICNGSGTILASYNIASVTHVGTGVFTFALTTAFSSANYVCVGTARQTAASNLFVEISHATAPTASAITAIVLTPALVVTDPDSLHVVFYGRQ